MRKGPLRPFLFWYSTCMKLGIRFSDNDFASYVRAFVEMFIVPTFKQPEPGHYTTYLTSSQVVELFNTHMPYVHRFMSWYYDTNHKHYYPGSNDRNKKLHELNLHKEWLVINEMDVYWDDQTDDYIGPWEDGNNSEFVWTDGVRVYIS